MLTLAEYKRATKREQKIFRIKIALFAIAFLIILGIAGESDRKIEQNEVGIVIENEN